MAERRRTNGRGLSWCGELGILRGRFDPYPVRFIDLFGDSSGGGTPGPFPNPEVKPACADDTWPATARESRSSPKGSCSHRGPAILLGRVPFLRGEACSCMLHAPQFPPHAFRDCALIQSAATAGQPAHGTWPSAGAPQAAFACATITTTDRKMRRCAGDTPPAR